MSDFTIMLIPGLTCDVTVWRPVLDSMADDAIVPSLTDHDDLTDMAHDCLTRVDGPLRVAGHSMGARVAMEMVRLAPNRIERLALLNTGIHPLKPGEPEKRAETIDFAYSNGMAALAKRWLPGMVHPQRHNDEKLMTMLSQMVQSFTPEQHARQINALINRPNASEFLPQITCPVLLIVGQDDCWSPVKQHVEMDALLTDSRLVIVPDAGHFAPVEQPDKVAAELVRFLTN